MVEGGTGRMRVYLYCAIPRSAEMASFGRSPKDRLKRQIKLWLGMMLWRLFDRFWLDSHDAAAVSQSNKGDIAIRESVEELLAGALSGEVEFREIGWDQIDERAIAEINQQGSLFVIAGSGYFMLDRQGRLAERLWRDADRFAELRVPIVCLAPGVNQHLTFGSMRAAPIQPEHLKVLRRIGDCLALTSVRDRSSADILESAGLPRPLVLADPAFFLSSQPPSPKDDPGRPLVGINFAIHAHELEPVLRAALPSIVPALKRFQRDTGCRFAYFVHASGERELWRLLRSSGLELDLLDLPPRDLLSHYGQLDMHVCMMMHSSILSLSRAVPTLALIYDRKSDGLFELVGLPEWTLAASSITEEAAVLERLHGLWEQRDSVRSHLSHRLPEMRAEMDTMLRQIDRLAADHTTGARDKA